MLPGNENALPLPVEASGVKLTLGSANKLDIEVSKPGKYALKMVDGKPLKFDVAELPPPIELNADWDVAFSPKDGGPEHVKFDKLISWSEHADNGVKYYSGTAVYTKKFTFRPIRSPRTAAINSI